MCTASPMTQQFPGSAWMRRARIWSRTSIRRSQPSQDKLRVSPACLEWQPKLNRKMSLHAHGVSPRVFATQAVVPLALVLF